ncbi:MAG: M20/M25/M40 family metallo-hydrolase [Acidobacteria bacterium]|nr:M20/M25/M40 family metallo-hydrolase [Acidobacteriota bacterium]
MKKTLLALLTAVLLFAQGWPSGPSPYREADRKLFAEIEKNNQLIESLEYLCDMIGPRLTGSDKLKRANQWTLEKFQAYGLENAHLESWSIGHGWSRGTAAGRIVEPAAQRLAISSAGWSPSTNGPVRGRVVYVKAEKPEEMEKYKGQLKGTVILTTEPAKVPSDQRAADRPPNAIAALAQERGEDLNIPPAERIKLRRQINEIYQKEGVAAVLRDSSKEHGLFNMGGVGGSNYDLGLIPTAYATHEDYALLWRLLEHKQPLEVEVDIHNEITSEPVEVYNTVAEIPGGEKANEVVIIGAHLDSWDLGEGATDNATGSSVALEVARAIRTSGLKPERTLRFILFSGEEQGLNGSRAYVKAHQSEMDKVQGVVIHDTGTGRVKSFALQNRYDLREAMDKLVEPLREVGLEELSLRWMGGSDHVPFAEVGVPAFMGIQDPAEYRKTHHSQSDTLDKIKREELVQGAKVVAALAWNLSADPEKLPRKEMEASSQSTE